MTADWKFATSEILVCLVAAKSCTLVLDQFNAETCSLLLRPETTTKPRKVSRPDPSPGNYELRLANANAAQDQSVSAQVVLK